MPRAADLGSGLERIVGDRSFTEGPIWIRRGSSVGSIAGPALLYSDLHDDRMWTHTRSASSVFRTPSHGANGNAVDRRGGFLTCEHGTRVVSRTDPDGARTVVASHFDGHRLNSPNDIVVASDGTAYFTDPPYGVADPDRELPFQGVFRLRLDGSTDLVSDDLVKPNGVALSPDESRLYVADTETGSVWSFELHRTGRIGHRRHVATVERPDGLVAHPDGRLFVACLTGVTVVSGASTATIAMPERPANLTFGDDVSTLYVCARKSVYRLTVG